MKSKDAAPRIVAARPSDEFEDAVVASRRGDDAPRVQRRTFRLNPSVAFRRSRGGGVDAAADGATVNRIGAERVRDRPGRRGSSRTRRRLRGSRRRREVESVVGVPPIALERRRIRGGEIGAFRRRQNRRRRGRRPETRGRGGRGRRRARGGSTDGADGDSTDRTRGSRDVPGRVSARRRARRRRVSVGAIRPRHGADVREERRRRDVRRSHRRDVGARVALDGSVLVSEASIAAAAAAPAPARRGRVDPGVELLAHASALASRLGLLHRRGVAATHAKELVDHGTSRVSSSGVQGCVLAEPRRRRALPRHVRASLVVQLAQEETVGEEGVVRGLVRAGMTTALQRRGARDRIGRETSALVVLLLRERAVIRSTAQDAGVRAVASLVDIGTRHGRPRASTRGSPSIPPQHETTSELRFTSSVVALARALARASVRRGWAIVVGLSARGVPRFEPFPGNQRGPVVKAPILGFVTQEIDPC